MRRGFDLFSVAGIKISVNYTWFIILGLVIWSLAASHFPEVYPDFDTFTTWLISVVAALLLFVSVLLHELSHSIVGNRLGLGIRGITLFIFGGIAHLGKEPEDPATEVKVAAAGPVCSLLLAALFLALYLILFAAQGDSPLVAVLQYLWFINAALLVFNLVPGFPLDGGRVLRAILWKKTGDVRRATRIASNFGKGFAFLLILLGLLQVFIFRNLGGIWFVLIGMFLQQTAEGSYRQVLVRNVLSGLKVRETMTTEVVSVDSSVRLDELVESYFFKYRFNSFPVVEGSKLVGIVDIHQVKQIPREQWASMTPKDVMHPISEELVLRPDDDTVEALTKMLKSGWGKLPVVAGDRLVGILTRRDVMALLKIKTDLGT
ncbi:MAG: site-2 protease family protein [Candidatus Eiseniibacteriota bacterium]|nr:MAG: site-2 protease family protein [Candidatus Eisenbacteria bacterium]